MKSTRFTKRVNLEKGLKSTVWGREFQHLIVTINASPVLHDLSGTVTEAQKVDCWLMFTAVFSDFCSPSAAAGHDVTQSSSGLCPRCFSESVER